MTTATVSVSQIQAGEKIRGRAGGILTMAYGLLAYAAFFGTFLYMLGFVGNWFVPKSIDSGAAGPLATSLLIDALLLGAFAVQHTIMARPAFKRWWTRVVPKSIERSTFVLIASGLLDILCWQWRPLPDEVWSVGGPAGATLAGISLAGWAIVFIGSLAISHFDLFGLRQTWLRFRNQAYAPVGFRLVGLYKLVRHPLMFGFLVAFWATPVMSVGHLWFAALATGYILLGTRIEERDLIAEHGERYLEYKRRVPGFLPLKWTGK